MCHVQWTHAFRRGEAVARGQALGTVGAAGRLGNNGTPHVHLELHRGGQARDPVPFSAASGGLSACGHRRAHGAGRSRRIRGSTRARAANSRRGGSSSGACTKARGGSSRTRTPQ